MKCNGCGSHMILERTESSSNSSSEWYQCTFCGKVRLTCSKTPLAPNYVIDYAIPPLLMAAEESALSTGSASTTTTATAQGTAQLEALLD